MKTFAIVAVLCALSVCSAAPFGFLGGLLGQNSQATGGAAGNVVTGSSSGPYQNSEIVQVSAQAGGSASGNAVSSNSASASHTGVSGIFGNHQQSNTHAVSNQQTFDSGLGGLLGGFHQQPYQNNFQPGYQQGYQPGYQPGYQQSYQPSYQQGYQPSYQQGYQQPLYQNQFGNGGYY